MTQERGDSLFKDVLCVHPSEEFGQFDGENDAGEEEDAAASQTEPERVLKHKHQTNSNKNISFAVNEFHVFP